MINHKSNTKVFNIQTKTLQNGRCFKTYSSKSNLPEKESPELSKKSYYVQLYAKNDNDNINQGLQKKIETQKVTKDNIPECTLGFFVKRCKDCGTLYYKTLLCGKEWCHECGANGSWVHQRRIARWWDKVMQIDTAGYLVVTLPAELITYLLDIGNEDVGLAKAILNNIRRYWKRKMKRELGIERGLIRYHWSGEDGNRFFPHLNYLIDYGYIDKTMLKQWRSDYLRWIESNYPVKIEAETTDIHYKYSNKTGKKIHWLKYITRATMREYNTYYAQIIYKFRNNVVFGKFEKQVEADKEHVLLEQNSCVQCGGELEVEGVIKINDFLELDRSFRDHGAGWFGYNDDD